VATAKGKRKAPAAPKVPESDAYSAEFVRGLVARGEAAIPNPDGTLPPGATHEIVGKSADGTPLVRRRRFSAF
jgi:hypothetical protein